MFKHATASAPELTQYLNKDAMVRSSFSMANPSDYLDVIMNYTELAVSPSQKAALAKLKEDLKDLSKVGKLTAGRSVALSADGKFQGESLVVADNNQALLDLIRKILKDDINKGAFHDVYKALGMDMNVTEDPQPRKVGGWDVYHYTLTVKAGAEMPAQERENVEKMFKGASIEVGLIGKYVMATMGEPLDVLADRLFNNTPGESNQATKAYPPGGFLYMDLSVPAMLNYMKQTLPADQAAKLPKFSPGAPPVVMAGYQADGMAYCRLGVPKSLLTSLGNGPAAAKPAGKKKK